MSPVRPCASHGVTRPPGQADAPPRHAAVEASQPRSPLAELPRAPRWPGPERARRHLAQGRSEARPYPAAGAPLQGDARRWLAALQAWVNAPAPDPRFEEQRVEAACRVWACLQRTPTSEEPLVLRLNALGLRALPPCLDAPPFEAPWTLDLSWNLLAPVPALAFKGLLELNLSSNGLRVAPVLEQLVSLRTLRLSDNFLVAAPSLRGMDLLQEVDLSFNELSAFPEVSELRKLEELDVLDLSENQIRTVPEEIAGLSRGLVIDLRANPLDEDAVAFLQGLEGQPRVLFDELPDLDIDLPASLEEEVVAWAPAQGALRERWAGFAHERHAGQFALLLRGLTGTAEHQRGGASARALGQRVLRVLDVLQHDEALRLRCFEIAEDGVGHCADRMALAFSDIEVAVQARALAGDARALWKLACGLFRLDEVIKIAAADVDGRADQEESVEIMAAYRVHLAGPLELPGQPAGMLFDTLSGVKTEQLEAAERRVRRIERKHPEAVCRFAAALPFWRESLASQPACAAAIERLEARRAAKYELLEQRLEAPDGGLNSARYDEEARKIVRVHEKNLERLFVGFTRAYAAEASGGGS